MAMLTEMLKPYCDSVVSIVGTASVKSRWEMPERLEKITKDESLAIIATGRYVGEGFDYGN